MEYVSELTRERVRYRANGYGPSLNLTSPNGSNDAFYIKIDQHYGASDHVTYMQHGIPAVMFITWPDMWYHSSQDTPDKQDPTQYKRAAIVGTGALAVIATGGDELAARVTSENLSRGTERMGVAERKGTSYLADAASARGAAGSLEGCARGDRASGSRGKGRHPIVGDALCGRGRCAEAPGERRGLDRQNRRRTHGGCSVDLRGPGPASQRPAGGRTGPDGG